MSSCLVTGGAGFIGSHLVDGLLENGHAVRVIDNLSTGNLANLAHVRDRIEMIEGDITNSQTVNSAMHGVDLIFHQAALASVPRSVADPTLPLSPYAVAKLAAEHYCAAFTEVYGLETVRLRYFNIFGPRQPPDSPYAAVIPLFFEAMLAGRNPVIYGDGQQSRDFTYVADAVQANLRAAKAPKASGKVYNIACGRRTSLLELVAKINALLETNLKPVHQPPRPGDV